MRREAPALAAWVALLAALAWAAPGFFSAANLRDMAVGAAPVVILASAMTLVILTGQIDISTGSAFAVLAVAAAMLARGGMPVALAAIAAAGVGAVLGAVNGALVAGLGMPSIVVTLAAMMVWRNALNWTTGGAWIDNLPGGFQWMGLGQSAGEVLIVGTAAALFGAQAWMLRRVAAVRAVYAAGSDAEAARLAGIPVRRLVFWVFVWMGAATGLAAALDAVRFREVQSNSGVGLELKAIAAVVVGGASITGGRGSLAGTLVGTGLLVTIGPALTFLKINAAWEKAIQGAILLLAVTVEIARRRGVRDGA